MFSRVFSDHEKLVLAVYGRSLLQKLPGGLEVLLYLVEAGLVVVHVLLGHLGDCLTADVGDPVHEALGLDHIKVGAVVEQVHGHDLGGSLLSLDDLLQHLDLLVQVGHGVLCCAVVPELEAYLSEAARPLVGLGQKVPHSCTDGADLHDDVEHHPEADGVDHVVEAFGIEKSFHDAHFFPSLSL